MPNGDDDKLRVILRSLLAVVPLVAWIVFVIWAGFVSHSETDPADVPEGLRLIGAASGTALATIAGAFLGIKPAVRSLTNFKKPDLSISGWATLAYFAGLAVAVFIWAFDSNRAYAAEVVQTALATLFGFAIGALNALTTPKTP